MGQSRCRAECIGFCQTGECCGDNDAEDEDGDGRVKRRGATIRTETDNKWREVCRRRTDRSKMGDEDEGEDESEDEDDHDSNGDRPLNAQRGTLYPCADPSLDCIKAFPK